MQFIHAYEVRRQNERSGRDIVRVDAKAGNMIDTHEHAGDFQFPSQNAYGPPRLFCSRKNNAT
jgi:hypothetical protein